MFAEYTQERIVADFRVTTRAYLKRLVEWVEKKRGEYDEFLEEMK